MKKTFCLGLRPASLIPRRLYANEFASIRHGDNDGTACGQNLIKSPTLRCGDKTHFVLNKKPCGWDGEKENRKTIVEKEEKNKQRILLLKSDYIHPKLGYSFIFLAP